MRWFQSLFLALSGIALTSGIAFAAEGGHGANWPDLAFRTITIAAVLGILWKAAGKRVVAYFRQRRDGIVEDFSSLESRRKTAEQELRDVERRIADLENERKAILEEYRAQGEQVKAEIIAKAEKSAAQIAEQARRTAENEVNQALAALRGEIAGEIISNAKRLLRERMTQEDHERLIDAALKKVVLQ